ncbi:hypothetical protein HK44_027475 [Pseudomonas fluorescens HK44]|uniref:Putative DNA-binding domain-containing protein n=1 Tax=Pseudomonas fluorescens HK44 TaxID=1042209 RepID=A0A010RQE9_PSEFL|nr:DNA-binding domain-containing protein [Pseudomonas fluorescens]EXF94676.1 hypothetical protein HK44_027475 [Pseudomonas fluorescens HK44]
MNTQADFAAALLDPRRPCPDGLFSANGADPDSRFAVYRNNVQSSLINALADSYPVVSQLVGNEFFRAMAQFYGRDFPPSSALINDYGSDFASFIEHFAPAASVPYLADVARLERLRVMAYHAADANAVEPARIAAALAAPEALAQLHIHLHPSTFTLSSSYATVALWAAHQTDTPPRNLAPYHPQSALVLRNGLEVEVFAIDVGTATFIHSLQNNHPLGQAVADALDAAPAFDLSQCLALLIGHNAIIHLQHDKVSP